MIYTLLSQFALADVSTLNFSLDIPSSSFNVFFLVEVFVIISTRRLLTYHSLWCRIHLSVRTLAMTFLFLFHCLALQHSDRRSKVALALKVEILTKQGKLEGALEHAKEWQIIDPKVRTTSFPSLLP